MSGVYKQESDNDNDDNVCFIIIDLVHGFGISHQPPANGGAI
jgi:hypothetical protein